MVSIFQLYFLSVFDWLSLSGYVLWVSVVIFFFLLSNRNLMSFDFRSVCCFLSFLNFLLLSYFPRTFLSFIIHFSFILFLLLSTYLFFSFMLVLSFCLSVCVFDIILSFPSLPSIMPVLNFCMRVRYVKNACVLPWARQQMGSLRMSGNREIVDSSPDHASEVHTDGQQK